jgi:hypothetical protein
MSSTARRRRPPCAADSRQGVGEAQGKRLIRTTPRAEFAKTVKHVRPQPATIGIAMKITHWRQALGLGFLSWLLPFLFAIPVFPLKQMNPPLFDILMSLAVIGAATLLGRRYFHGSAGQPAVIEAMLVGFLWLAINLVCDYPMFSYGPMKMTAGRYYSEIGASYLLYPAFLAGSVWVAR